MEFLATLQKKLSLQKKIKKNLLRRFSNASFTGLKNFSEYHLVIFGRGMLARLFRFEYPNHWSLQAAIGGGQPGARERAANRLKFFDVNFLFLALLVHHDQAPGYTDPCRPISGETNLVNGGRFQIRKFIRVALPEGLLRLQAKTAKINSDDRLRAMPSNLDGSPDNPFVF